MEIILRFTWRNIRENKFRTFLILLSVILSAALFLGSTALAGTIEKTYVELLKKYYGSAELMIHANKNSPSDFLSTSQLEPYLKEKLSSPWKYPLNSRTENCSLGST